MLNQNIQMNRKNVESNQSIVSNVANLPNQESTLRVVVVWWELLLAHKNNTKEAGQTNQTFFLICDRGH